MKVRKYIHIPPAWKIYSILIALPIVILQCNQILYDDRLWTDIHIWRVSSPILLAFILLTWYLNLGWDERLQKKHPSIQESWLRVRKKFLRLLLWIPVSIAALLCVYHYGHIQGYRFQYTDFFEGCLVSLVVNILFRVFYEGHYIFEQYKESKMEKAVMAQLSLQQEFETLKNQINPHFLFNCFNTLSSLISVDKKRADQFLNELSKVYRYLLRNNMEMTSTVASEMNFINSYFQLLKTRHGDAIMFNTQIEKKYESYWLPSLSLQLLVENAVKHNMLSKNKPLTIHIFTIPGNKLVIHNNLQRRIHKVPSNKIGLENIKTKYLLLKQPGFQVMEDEKNFTVVLPLIWKEATLSSTYPRI
jgi:two-component system, LytTR family, sensor kinase